MTHPRGKLEVIAHCSAIHDVLKSLALPAHQKGLELTLRITPDVPADLHRGVGW
jgi:hypothetical protein